MNDNFQFLKEGLISDLVSRVMEDYNLDMEKALDVVYFSDTIAKLSDPATSLYKESAAYVYSILQDELRRGKL